MVFTGFCMVRDAAGGAARTFHMFGAVGGTRGARGSFFDMCRVPPDRQLDREEAPGYGARQGQLVDRARRAPYLQERRALQAVAVGSMCCRINDPKVEVGAILGEAP